MHLFGSISLSFKYRINTCARSLIDWYLRKAIDVSISACMGSLTDASIDISYIFLHNVIAA